MAFLRNWLRHYRDRRHVRPWALAVPIVVLLIAVPLLRPGRHPDLGSISDDELARPATVQALGEQNTPAIDGSRYLGTRTQIQRNGHRCSNQPPLMAGLVLWPHR